MRKIVISFLSLAAVLCLASCSNVNNNNDSGDVSGSDEDNSQNDNNNSENQETDVDSGDKITNAIVVYYSATNHTEAVAETIATHINSEIYELEPVDDYTSADLNYSNQSSRVVQEHNRIESGEDVQIDLVTTDLAGFDDAEYVFLGAPVWWQELSWVIEEFVSENDFTGKTIIPFGTSASSGFSLENIEPLAEEANWMSPQRFRSSVSKSEVTNWIDGLNISFN